MAEVDTQLLSTQHSDIRRENSEHYAAIQLENMKGFDRVNADVLTSAGNLRYETAEHAGDIIKEGLKATAITDGAIKDSRYEVSSRVEHAADRSDRNFSQLADRFFTVARDTADLRAQVVQAIDTTKMSGELNSLKGIIEGQKNTTYLGDKITTDGDRTRSLINDLKYHDLSRALVERNAELVEERHGRRHWRGVADQNQFGAQFAQLSSMMQNFNSQLADTRQGMVNFGTMSGQSGQQTSTANNVR